MIPFFFALVLVCLFFLVLLLFLDALVYTTTSSALKTTHIALRDGTLQTTLFHCRLSIRAWGTAGLTLAINLTGASYDRTALVSVGHGVRILVIFVRSATGERLVRSNVNLAGLESSRVTMSPVDGLFSK